MLKIANLISITILSTQVVFADVKTDSMGMELKANELDMKTESAKVEADKVKPEVKMESIEVEMEMEEAKLVTPNPPCGA
ncbi:hypothetical protein QUF74_16970 [Candidatus Halobeggiatoa sp. HSG11]|nr:hypothetical protein [Candidatus Halobeggiatoa sp. HSG11]